MGMDIRVLDSLQKVFADEELPAGGTAGVTALRGERVNFQVACRSTQVARMLVAARAQLPFSGEADLYDVGQAPVALPAMARGTGSILAPSRGCTPIRFFRTRGSCGCSADSGAACGYPSWCRMTPPRVRVR